jgi:transcriptional regulator with XRE-family HTH domain
MISDDLMINEKLRQLKKQSSMTTQELSIKSRIPLPTIHKLLSGETTNPKYNTLTAFLDALDHELTIQSIYEEESPALSIMERDIIARYQGLSNEGKRFISDTLDQFSAYEQNEITPKPSGNSLYTCCRLLPVLAAISIQISTTLNPSLPKRFRIKPNTPSGSPVTVWNRPTIRTISSLLNRLISLTVVMWVLSSLMGMPILNNSGIMPLSPLTLYMIPLFPTNMIPCVSSAGFWVVTPSDPDAF